MTTLEHVPGAAGLDEAGRGPLAGPVVAAAVILPDGFDLSGLNDSKQLSPEDRWSLEGRIKSQARWCVCFADREEIDRLNILWASMAAMERAYRGLEVAASRILVDGNKVPRSLECSAYPVIKGDATYACIAAASILAKTARDRFMVEIAATYPGYGFERHFGYPTPEHFGALEELGPCDLHRRSFAPVAALTQGVLAL